MLTALELVQELRRVDRACIHVNTREAAVIWMVDALAVMAKARNELERHLPEADRRALLDARMKELNR